MYTASVVTIHIFQQAGCAVAPLAPHTSYLVPHRDKTQSKAMYNAHHLPEGDMAWVNKVLSTVSDMECCYRQKMMYFYT